MNKDIDIKSKELGMPFGTANHRLRKAILFKYIKRCEDDICFKCKEQIVSVDELSVEHKKPWQGRDITLFWDLDNIAFSHLLCNKRDMIYPSGREHGHKKYNQERCRCDKCREAKVSYQKKYRSENKEAINKRRRDKKARLAQRQRQHV